MSMLAEPRRKEKWTLNPRGKFWSEDKNKFGQRMLEKMGWSEGKGLGANEQGATSHVAVKVKNDSKGLGTSIKDGEWCRHQEQFENLLANLNDTAETEVSTSSITSLEEKSKNSKKRLHYAKFTRGKDLTLYSKKDLDCILGVGVRKEEKPETDDLKEDVGAVDTLYGVTTIIGGSLDDYFRKKMASQPCNVDNGLEKDDANLIGKSRKRKADNNEEELKEMTNDDPSMIVEDVNAEDVCKKKKKKKKAKNDADEQTMLLEDVDSTISNDVTLGISKEKKKFKENVIEENIEEEIKVLEDSEWKRTEKKKKKSIYLDGEILESDITVIKEKRRKKGSRSASGNVMQNHTEEESKESFAESLKESYSRDDSKCVENSGEEIQVLDRDDIPEINGNVTKKVECNVSDDSRGSERSLKKKCKKKRKKEKESEEVVFLEEICLVEDDKPNTMEGYSTAVSTKSKKLKVKGPSIDKNLESIDEDVKVVEKDEDSGRRSIRTESGSETVVLKEKKKKEKKKSRLLNVYDAESKVDDQPCDILQSVPKKSKKSKEKKSLTSEVNNCDEMPYESRVEMPKEKVDKLTGKDTLEVIGSVQVGTVINSDSPVKENQDSLLGHSLDKCKGSILNCAVKQVGEVNYYSCLKKKESKGVATSATEIIHVFHGANLKDIKGYDKE